MHTIGITLIRACSRVYAFSEVRLWFSRQGSRLPHGVGHWRHQVAGGPAGRELSGIMEHALRQAGILGARKVPAAGVYSIRTEEGAGMQWPAHTDYAHAAVQHLLHDRARVPLSALWAASAAFELWDITGTRRVHVPAGMVAVFRADYWHCGGPHLSDGMRVHGFVVPEGVSIPSATYTK